jgi:outer membrane lipoprotein-sorting protein
VSAGCTVHISLVLLVASALTSSPAHPSSEASLEEVAKCLADNVPPASSALTVRLRSRDRGGSPYEHAGRIEWKRSEEGLMHLRICMMSPPAIRGLAYLVREGEAGHDVWAYLPEEERVVRIRSKTAANRARIARTAISYLDLRYLPVNLNHADSAEGFSESTLGDRKVSVVGLAVPPGENAVYERIVSFVDAETCVPLRIEFYETGDRLRKVLTADPDSIASEGPIRLAHSMRIRDLKSEVETEVVVEQVEVDAELPDRLFTPTQLERGRCLR